MALWRQGLVTVASMAIVESLYRVPLPGLASGGRPVAKWSADLLHLGALGISPVLIGFVAVELFSLTPAGRRWRAGGVGGRARLNRAAAVASLLMGFVLGGWVGWILQLLSGQAGAVVAHPGAGFTLMTALTFTAVTAVLLAVVTLIRDHGLGDGVVWLIAWHFVAPLGRDLWDLVDGRTTEPVAALFGLLWLLPIFALCIGLGMQRYHVAALTPAGEPLRMRLPAMPQGVIPISWTLLILWLAADVWTAVDFGHSWPPQLHRWTPAESICARLVLIPGLAWLTYRWFGSPRRVAANLGALAPRQEEAVPVLRRQFFVTTLALTAGAVALFVLNLTVPWSRSVQRFDVAMALCAIGFDLHREIVFTRRHGRGARLLLLDNVHLAAYLTDLLHHHGIAAVSRSASFRSLLYYINPAVKIDLRVPAARLDEARALLPPGGLDVI